MNPYATPDQVRDIIRLRNNAVKNDARIPIDSVGADVITQQITEATGVVDTYCSGKRVPAGLLTSMTVAIAAWSLVLTYMGQVDLADADPIIRRHAWAMSILEDIGSGKINPVSDPPNTGGDDEFAGAAWNPPTPCLTTVDWWGRPTVVDQPWGYPGAW